MPRNGHATLAIAQIHVHLPSVVCLELDRQPVEKSLQFNWPIDSVENERLASSGVVIAVVFVGHEPCLVSCEIYRGRDTPKLLDFHVFECQLAV